MELERDSEGRPVCLWLNARSQQVAYRVQAADGRGPWRRGWSHVWIEADADADRLMETIMDLMPVSELRALPPTMAYGCACRTKADLLRWFTPKERAALERHGFYPVRLNIDVVLVESPWQMLVGRYRPFAQGATRLRWAEQL